MMEDFYDTGYDYAGFDIYVGHGFDTPWYRDLPFIAQADLIRDLQKGRINLSAKSTFTHGAVVTGATLGAHWATTKGLLDPALFNLRYAQLHARHVMRMGYFHAARGALISTGRAMPGIGAGMFAALIWQGAQNMMQALNPDMPAFGDMSGWTA